ncbi:unnamed protein product, partial [Prorocentrum cordatum]
MLAMLEQEGIEGSPSLKKTAESLGLDRLESRLAKRRKLRTELSQPDAGDDRAADSAAQGSQLAVAAAVEPEPAKKERNGCPGCGRVYGVLMSFFQPAFVEWGLPDGRGLWCKDCMGLFRLTRKEEGSLTTWQGKLSKIEVTLDWEFDLMVWIQLKKEGKDRIDDVVFKLRKDSLKWLLENIGIPTGPFVVALLSDRPSMLTDDGMKTLRCVATSSGVQLGALMPLHQTLTHEQLQQSVEIPIDHCTAIQPYNPQPPKIKTPLEVKFDVITDGAKELLTHFATADWNNVKESSFTTHITEVGGVQGEAQATGAESIVELAILWAEGLSMGKHAMKCCREYVKLTAFGSFLSRTARITAHYSYHLTCLKGEFVNSGCVMSMGLDAATKAMVSNGLAGLLEEMIQDSKARYRGIIASSPDAWFRGFFLGTALARICETKLSEIDNQRTRFINELTTCMEEIAQVAQHIEDLKDSSAEVKALRGIIGGALGTQASDVNDAIHVLGAPRMKPILEHYGGKPTWMELQSSAQLALQRNAADDAGDERVAYAIHCLTDGVSLCLDVFTGGPTEGQVSAHLVINNVRVVTEFKIFNAVEEAAFAVQEALSTWSAIRKSERLSLIYEWVQTATTKVASADIVLCYYTYHIAKRTGDLLNSSAQAFGSTGGNSPARREDQGSLDSKPEDYDAALTINDLVELVGKVKWSIQYIRDTISSSGLDSPQVKGLMDILTIVTDHGDKIKLYCNLIDAMVRYGGVPGSGFARLKSSRSPQSGAGSSSAADASSLDDSLDSSATEKGKKPSAELARALLDCASAAPDGLDIMAVVTRGGDKDMIGCKALLMHP